MAAAYEALHALPGLLLGPAAPTADDAIPADCIKVAFAEARWYEREAQFEKQLAELRSQLEQACDDGASEAAPSELGTDDLVQDSGWTAVTGTKSRRAALDRSKKDLAKKLHTKLGSLTAARSAEAASPFKRTRSGAS